MRSRFFGLIISLVAPAAAFAGWAQAHQFKVALPRVSAAAVPLYPLQAYLSNVEGTVLLRVTTDGHRVVATHVEQGHRLLAAAAQENVQTWQFQVHEPAT